MSIAADANTVFHKDIPLSVLYEATAFALSHRWQPEWTSDPSQIVQDSFRLESLLKGYVNCGGPPPLSSDDRRILSGMDQFHRVVAMPGYYCIRADREIQKEHRATLASYMSPSGQTPAMLVEVCVGHGESTATLLSEIGTAHWPQEIIVNDAIADNTIAAAKTLKKAGYPHKRISRITGDVLKERFWKELDHRLSGLGADGPVVMMQGATFNDFSNPEMNTLLHNFSLVEPAPLFLLTIDNTTDPTALKAAYDNYALRQLALTGIKQYTTDNHIPFDASKAQTFIDIVPKEQDTDIQMGARESNNVFEYVPIIKKPYDSLREKFRVNRFNITARLPWSNPQPPATNYSLYALRIEKPRQPYF